MRSRPGDSAFESRRQDDAEFGELVRALLSDAENPLHVLLKRRPHEPGWAFESDYYCTGDVAEDARIYARQGYETRALDHSQAAEVCAAWTNDLWKAWCGGDDNK